MLPTPLNNPSEGTPRGGFKTCSKQPFRGHPHKTTPSEGIPRGSVKTCSKQPLRRPIIRNPVSGGRTQSPPGEAFSRFLKNCRRGCLEDGQPPKGLLRGAVEKWRGSRAEGGRGGGNLPLLVVNTRTRLAKDEGRRTFDFRTVFSFDFHVFSEPPSGDHF